MPLIKHTARSRGIVAMIGWFGMLVFLVYGAITARTEWMWAHAMRPRTFANQLSGPPIPREEVLSIASSYAGHTWTATAQNVKHGPDAHGIDVQTPNAATERAEPGKWQVGENNVGMPYKWGGFDTPKSFDAGVATGKRQAMCIPAPSAALEMPP